MIQENKVTYFERKIQTYAQNSESAKNTGVNNKKQMVSTTYRTNLFLGRENYGSVQTQK